MDTYVHINTLGELVELSSTRYTFPKDGYVWANVAGSSSFIVVNIYDKNDVATFELRNHGESSNSWITIPVFVKQGMKAQVSTGSTGNFHGYYMPFES